MPDDVVTMYYVSDTVVLHVRSVDVRYTAVTVIPLVKNFELPRRIPKKRLSHYLWPTPAEALLYHITNLKARVDSMHVRIAMAEFQINDAETLLASGNLQPPNMQERIRAAIKYSQSQT